MKSDPGKKTTLIRHLLNQLDDTCLVGLISNTHHSFGNLIQWIFDAFDLSCSGKDEVALYRQFVDFLIREYAKGHRVVLIIDEAQNMSKATLEQLRVISNINADKDFVLQLAFVGQPELRAILSQSDMQQFAQRLGANYRLPPLDMADTTEYARHRVKVAGGDPAIFERDALTMIWNQSGGIPQLINSICNRFFVYAYAESAATVTVSLAWELVEEKRRLGSFGFLDGTPQDGGISNLGESMPVPTP